MSIKTVNYRRSLARLAPDEQFLHEKEELSNLLDCIEARGWRSHLCTNELGVSTCRIVVNGDYEFDSDYSDDELNALDFDPSVEKESRAEVILYAYVKALAAQRKIADGSSWRHFKGDRVEVKCEAFLSGGNFRSYGEWVLEEDPQKEVRLQRQDDIWFYTSKWAIQTGDRGRI